MTSRRRCRTRPRRAAWTTRRSHATIRSAWKGGQIKDRTAELPDFVFEVPGQAPGGRLVMPDVAAAIYHFEDAYDAARATATGEFIVRAAVLYRSRGRHRDRR